MHLVSGALAVHERRAALEHRVFGDVFRDELALVRSGVIDVPVVIVLSVDLADDGPAEHDAERFVDLGDFE